MCQLARISFHKTGGKLGCPPQLSRLWAAHLMFASYAFWRRCILHVVGLFLTLLPGWSHIKELPVPSILCSVDVFLITDSFEAAVRGFSFIVQVSCKLPELITGPLSSRPRQIISIWFSRPSLFIRVDPLLAATSGELFSSCCSMGTCADCSLESF